MNTNNTHSTNTASESRPVCAKDAAPFFLCRLACQSIRRNRASTADTCTRLYPYRDPLGKPGTSESHRCFS